MNIDDITNQINSLPEEAVADIASNILGSPSAVTGTAWSATPFEILSVGEGTLGLWKVAGTSSNGASSSQWQAILKAVDPDAEVTLAAFNHAWRELGTLRSGQLSKFRSGLLPVSTYGITDRPDGTAWIWMKDMSGAIQPPWRAESFLTSARHIGMFNGNLPASDRPEGNWIATDGSTDRRATGADFYEAGIASLLKNADHHGIVQATSSVGFDRVLSLYDDLKKMIEATRSFPQSVAHNDVHTRNLFPWDDEITIAIDWASIGLAPTGVDGGGLAGSSITWSQSEADLIAEIEPKIFAEYLSGLRESGWDGDESAIRLVYLSTFASYVLLLSMLLNQVAIGGPRVAKNRQRLGVVGDEVYDRLASRFEQFIPLVDEGLALIR